VVGYRLENEKYAVLHVMNYGLWSNVRARAPVVAVLNWFSDTVPAKEDIAGLTYLNHAGGRTLDQELKKRLWPYWEDPTRLVHVDEPPAGASEAEAHAFYEEQRRMLFGSL
jgi:hypothetical protein